MMSLPKRRVVIFLLVLAEVPDLLLEVALEEHSLITPADLPLA
jgi:hypothetical protein